MTKIYSMKNKHPERQPQKAISSGCSFQRYFSSSLPLVIHKRLVLTPASWHYFSRGGGSILKEDPVEPVHDVLHRIADLLLIDRKAGIQHSLNGVRRVSKVITDAVEMVLCQDRLPFFGEDVVIEEPTVSLVGTASYCRLDTSRWHYLKITPLKACVPKLLELKNALIVCIVIGFALLAICSLGVLLFLYFPVYQVRAALRNIGMENKGELAGQVSQLAQQSEAHRKASALQSLLEGQDPGLLPELPAPYTLVLMETGHALPALRQTYTDVSALTYHQDGCEVVLFFGEERETVLAICREWADQSSIYCFCGSERTTFPQVVECYQVLREMRRQKFWAADRHCWQEEDFTPRRPHSSFTEQMSAELASALRGSDLEQIQRLWQQIQDSIREDRFQDQLFAFQRIVSLMEKQLPALKPLVSDNFWATLKDIQTLDAIFSDAFRKIVQNNRELHRQHIDQLASQVVRQIEQSYADSDLSPTRIADSLGMSSAYLGRIFRESMQTSISQYLNQTRIRRAEELLRETEQPVETVAGLVGFSNPKYFYVVFKNITGQTPLQFRKAVHSASEKN